MTDIIEKIKLDAINQLKQRNAVDIDWMLYIDHKVFEAKETLDIVHDRIVFEKSSYVVFADPHPDKNWAHPCQYLIYDAKTGKLIKSIDARFPYFLNKKPETLELFRSARIVQQYQKKTPLRIPLEPAKLSAYRKLAPFPLTFCLTGRRYAILFSGSSNCRHVNDMEFLYRTLIDVYGYQSGDIYVLNRDGTLSWNPEFWEPPVSNIYPVDGTPFRMVVNGAGNRTGFQAVINQLASRMTSRDCLFIHTNNHGDHDPSKNNESYMVAWKSHYYASEFAADLATLPNFNILLVMMEQCGSGGFLDPIVSGSIARTTVAQSSVPWNEYSAGGWPFDPWAEMWISAMAGVRGDGSALAVSPDDNLNSRISAWEAYDYALSIDNPVMRESSTGASESVYLSSCCTKVKIKEFKEFKEFKEYKEFKEFKDIKDRKEIEPKQWEPKSWGEPKQSMEPKTFEIPGYEGYLPYVTEQLGQRLERLENLVAKLSPFISSELRPDLSQSAFKKEGDE